MKNSFRCLKKLRIFVAACAIFCCTVLDSSAQAVSYQYNHQGVAVPAPNGYDCAMQIRSDQIEKSADWDPSDLFLDEDGMLNVLSASAGKVYVFSQDLQYQKTVTFLQDGSEAFLMGLKGLYVYGRGENKRYYVADPERERVFIADSQGNIVDEIRRPNTNLIDESVTFAPEKVLVNKTNGYVYVLVPGIYYGACVFSPEDYQLITFLGGNTVEATTFLLADYFWKKILNEKQIEKMRRYIPISFANFTLDSEGYLYTVTNKTALGTQFENEIKKFNTNNVNILPKKDYGDLEIGKFNKIVMDTSYVDIAVNDQGYIFAVDANLCRVAVFSKDGDRLFTFGGRGNRMGMFDTISAIEVSGENIYVLDQYYETITLFTPNQYGRDVYAATSAYLNGEYEKSRPLWEKVLRQNAGFSLAHVGLGRAYLEKGEYAGAMEMFRTGNDKKGYSEAFYQYRAQIAQELFAVLFLLAVAAVLLLLIADKKSRRRNNYLNNPVKKNLFGKVRYTLIHPGEGGFVLARHTPMRQGIILSIGIVCSFFIASVLEWQKTGFIFNPNDPEDFEVKYHILKTFGLFYLWVISAWFVSNLMDSSARISDIMVVSSVSLIPYILGLLIKTLASNLLTLDEAGFLSAMNIIMILWSVALLVGGLREISEMNFRQTFLFIAFTLIGILIILFLVLLLWSLMQHVITFFAQVFEEFIKMDIG